MNERCRDVMTKDPVCCVPEDTVQRAAQLMRDQDVGSIPICENQAQKLIAGILTDRDLALKIIAEGRDAKNTRVRDVMRKQVFTCRPEDDLKGALDAMERHQVRRIPVVDENRCVIGIIAQADIATRLRNAEKTAEVVAEISKPSARAGGA